MENADKVENYAQENMNISIKEKDIATQSKMLAKAELKRAKAIDGVIKQEVVIAKVRERLALEITALAKRKQDKRDLLKLDESVIKKDKEIATYNEKQAKNQTDTAEIRREISQIEKEIAEERIHVAEKRMKIAKSQGNLSKKQFSYVKLARSGALDEKLKKAEKLISDTRKDLTQAREEFVKKSEDLKKKENKLADAKKDLSEKISAGEKIRHPS